MRPRPNRAAGGSLHSSSSSSLSNALKRKRVSYDPLSPSTASRSSDSGDDLNRLPTLSSSSSSVKDRRKKKVTTIRANDDARRCEAFDNDKDEEETVDKEDNKVLKKDLLARRIHTAFVLNALSEMEKGNNEPLISLTGQLSGELFTPEGLAPSQVYHTVSTLVGQVDRLDNRAATPLINAVINLNGIDVNPATLGFSDRRFFSSLVRIHGQFLGVLVSSMPKWYAEVARRIVGMFSSSKEWSLERWHVLLRYLVGLVPTSASALQNAIVKLFPYKYDDAVTLLRYVSNILRVAEYVPDLRASIWGVLIERAVELDVDIENKIEELEEEEEEEDEDDEIDEEDSHEVKIVIEDDLNSWRSIKLKKSISLEDRFEEDEEILDAQLTAGHGNEHGHDHETDPSTVKNMAIKLDYLIAVLIQSLKTSFNRATSDDSLLLYSELLSHFIKYVLPTHRTHAVQFLFFSISQVSPDFTDAFLALLLETALSPSEMIVQRQMAMTYLASYVARARAVDRTQLRSVVSIVCGWITRYVNEREKEALAVNDMSRFRMFYSVVQGLFYIFCFHHSSLLVDDDVTITGSSNITATTTTASIVTAGSSGRSIDNGTMSWACDVSAVLQRAISTRFNPLKWCNPTVVTMFAKIAQREGAAYCFSVMEQNRRVGRVAAAAAASMVTADVDDHKLKTNMMRPLEGYFPFDPVILKRTSKMVQHEYISWDEVSGDLSDDESEDDDDDDDDSDNESESESESDSDVDASEI
ncbi:RNA polymerase I-specific transcription initiation factor RRN3 [Lipomyces japonicus]|uniref:RNA polymerase I-specific transcription initiation factor RRN3 n=1 Tax=Lipomyces japonicus TaxID=56871 RepID=UPI0034CF3D39